MLNTSTVFKEISNDKVVLRTTAFNDCIPEVLRQVRDATEKLPYEQDAERLKEFKKKLTEKPYNQYTDPRRRQLFNALKGMLSISTNLHPTP